VGGGGGGGGGGGCFFYFLSVPIYLFWVVWGGGGGGGFVFFIFSIYFGLFSLFLSFFFLVGWGGVVGVFFFFFFFLLFSSFLSSFCTLLPSPADPGEKIIPRLVVALQIALSFLYPPLTFPRPYVLPSFPPLGTATEKRERSIVLDERDPSPPLPPPFLPDFPLSFVRASSRIGTKKKLRWSWSPPLLFFRRLSFFFPPSPRSGPR